MEAVNSVVKDEEEFIDAFRDNVIRILGSYSDNVEPTEYDEKIDALQKQMLALIEDSAKTESADEEFDRAYREIADQIRAFKKNYKDYEFLLVQELSAEGYAKYLLNLHQIYIGFWDTDNNDNLFIKTEEEFRRDCLGGSQIGQELQL